MKKIVNKVFEHQFTKDYLLEQLLQQYSNENNLKTELCRVNSNMTVDHQSVEPIKPPKVSNAQTFQTLSMYNMFPTMTL